LIPTVPPVSVAVAPMAERAATAAAEPPEEPPGTRSEFAPFLRQGFFTAPWVLVMLDEPMANSSMLSLPSMTAPACQSLAETVDS
jgi:hypothetical protein